MDEHLLIYLDIQRNPKAIETALALYEKAMQFAHIHTWQHCCSLKTFMDLFAPFIRKSSAVLRLLEGANNVCLMAATIGDAVEKAARKYLADKESFKGFIMDRMGSYLVEQEIRKMDQKITRKAEGIGMAATRRYSPGYQGFSLKAQKVFVELIGSAWPDLQLTDGFMIKPEKTITAIKGVGYNFSSGT